MQQWIQQLIAPVFPAGSKPRTTTTVGMSNPTSTMTTAPISATQTPPRNICE